MSQFLLVFALTFFLVCRLCVAMAENHGSHEANEWRLDPFHEISHGPVLSVRELYDFTNQFFESLKCDDEEDHDHEDESHEEDHEDESHVTCKESQCIDVSDLIALVGGNASVGITEDQFDNASVVLLYLATQTSHHCHQHFNVSSLSVEDARSSLLTLAQGSSPEHEHIHSWGMKSLLDSLKDFINHEGHDHEEEDEHEHEHEDGEDSDHTSHEDHLSEEGDDHHGDQDVADDHDSHEDEHGNHTNHDSHEDEHGNHTNHDSHEDEHGNHTNHDSHEDEHGNHTDHDSHEDEHGNHSNHDSHEDEHNSHEEEDDDHRDTVSMNLVVEPKCLAPDSLLYYMTRDNVDYIDSQSIGSLASMVVFLLAKGSDIEDSCRLLPAKTGFVDGLYSEFASTSSSMNVADLEKLMTSLSINPESEGHSGDSHDGHDHRRKRSIDTTFANTRYGRSSRRVRRQAPNDPFKSQCYSAEQLLALYDVSSSMDQSVFQQLCPSLISQKLFGVCTSEEKKQDSVSDVEKYVYSSLAVLIICLCSIFGVVLIPCASHGIYSGIIATFLGLAVGTLFGDAILHLIPSSFGVHAHEEGHDHSSDIVVEEFVRFGVVMMAALYFFYIIELVMSRYGGHSHNKERADGGNHIDHECINDIKMTAVKTVDEEEGKAPTLSDYKMEEKYSPGSKLQFSKPGCLGMPPVAVMVVLGDAIHNFADGMVMGASFSKGVSTGIATSIAVFCHELPHELGDFAVLIQSGCSFGKAVFLNLLSSLTAFIGLYVGLSLANDFKTEQWIFAVAAGMFIYIALVDLLPQLLKGNCSSIFFNNVGMLTGFVLMFLLVIFEEHIEV